MYIRCWANDGIDGLALALYNKSFFVHAFEANPNLIKIIKSLKKKIESRKGIKLNNYRIHNYAISNKDGIKNFYISINHKVSSLNKLSKNIDKSWPGYSKTIFKVKKKIKIKTFSLETFLEKNKIFKVRYLHIDTQGHDLKVLKGLKNKINNVEEGRIEAALTQKKAAYKDNHTVKDVKNFFITSPFKIKKIEKIFHISKNKILNNEVDIFFFNKNIKIFKKINNNYNQRYFIRLLNGKLTLKDNILDFFIRFINLIKLN